MAEVLVVNGDVVTIEPRVVDGSGAERSLLSVLREQLGLTGAKPGCGEGACGACTVLLDGRPVRACVTPVSQASKCRVTTVEGLARPAGRLHPVQRAFTEVGALQCGYCTPGMVMQVAALVATEPDPDDARVRAALNGNLCRCGTYPRILQAVQRAVQLARADGIDGADVAFGDESAGSPGSLVSVVVGGLDTACRAGSPWDLTDPVQRDWFEVLGDGVMVVADNGNAAAWLHVGADATATLLTGKVDLGQGTGRALGLLVAQHLAGAVRAVRVVMGDTDHCPWDMGTFGSQSMPRVGAAVRAAAMTALAAIKDSGSSPRRLITVDVEGRDADGAAVSGQAGVRLGHDLGAVPDPAGQEVVTGARAFASDVRRPGMLAARVLRPPVPGAQMRSLDLGDVRDRPGVTVVQDGDFVAVAGQDRDLVQDALAAIQVEWDVPEPAPIPDVERHLRDHPVHRQGWGGNVDDIVGDPEEIFSRAPLRVSATYRTAFLAHVPMETRSAVVEWEQGRLTAWTGTQVPFGVRAQVADALQLEESAVRIVVPPTGGGFGGKHTGALVVEAARVARETGTPVQVRCTRAEEFTLGHVRPAAVIDVQAACADGAVVGYQLIDVNAGAAGFTFPYDVRHRRQVFQPADFPAAQGPYRALAATANTFARECLLDEVSQAMRADPLELRRLHLTDERTLAVLDAAASRFGWSTRQDGNGRGNGLALGLEKGGRVATAATVEVDDEGHVRVERVVTAFECGAVVDPDNLVNQIEGATVMGLGGAVFEELTWDGYRLSPSSINAYRLPRFPDLPTIEVVLIDRPDLPSAGGGETPIIALAPAIANAVFAATGQRIRDLPIAPSGTVRPPS